MRLKQLFATLCLMLLAAGAALPLHAATLIPLKTAWLGEHEAFPVWYAKQKGWDKEVGLDLAMLRFDSGKALVEGLAAYKWAIAGCGAVPALTAVLSDRLNIIATANDEAAANAIYVRADSPILTVRGANAAFPKVYGNAATVAGKTILCPKGTSAHYLLLSWLKTLGLSEKDVRVKYMEHTPTLGAFSGGLGDAAALWAPLTYGAEEKGFKAAATGADCGLFQPVLLVADKEYASKYPQHIEAFLKMYFHAVDAQRATPAKDLAPEYVRFLKEWAGRTISEDQAARDLAAHPVFDLREQLALFDTSQGRSRMQNRLADITAFYAGIGAVRPNDVQRLERMNDVTDVYLKAVR